MNKENLMGILVLTILFFAFGFGFGVYKSTYDVSQPSIYDVEYGCAIVKNGKFEWKQKTTNK